MASSTIAVACDHGGFHLKDALVNAVRDLDWDVLDLGTNSVESVDYPQFGYAMARAIKNSDAERGILICGSGIGISIAANRFIEVRAALIHDGLGARLARQHNDANVICFGGRMIGPDLAVDCLKIFLSTPFEGGRHARRVDQLSDPR